MNEWNLLSSVITACQGVFVYPVSQSRYCVDCKLKILRCCQFIATSLGPSDVGFAAWAAVIFLGCSSQGGKVSRRMLQNPQPTVPRPAHGSCEYSRPVYNTEQASRADWEGFRVTRPWFGPSVHKKSMFPKSASFCAHWMHILRTMCTLRTIHAYIAHSEHSVHSVHTWSTLCTLRAHCALQIFSVASQEPGEVSQIPLYPRYARSLL